MITHYIISFLLGGFVTYFAFKARKILDSLKNDNKDLLPPTN